MVHLIVIPCTVDLSDIFNKMGLHYGSILKDGLGLQKYCQSANYFFLSSVIFVFKFRPLQSLTKAGDSTIQAETL